MKIAVITQKLDPDDYVFGFFYGHIIDLSRVCEKVHVVCLEVGKNVNLPDNVIVHSLGKEEGKSKIEYIQRLFAFIAKYNRDYDTVFVHMEPRYVLLGGGWWRLTGKRIILWYNHVYHDTALKVASYIAHEIISVSKAGVPVKHKQTRYMSHGEDLTDILTDMRS